MSRGTRTSRPRCKSRTIRLIRVARVMRGAFRATQIDHKVSQLAEPRADPTSRSGRYPCSQGQTVTLSISFTATYGKIITFYSAGGPGGTLTVSNSCPDGAPSLSTTSTGSRAVVSGRS